jgi:polyhydroxyalkanoate synthesis regulator phasin
MGYDLSEDQYLRILSRLTAVEEAFNDLATALSRYASVSQVQELLVVNKAAIDEVTEQVDALEERVTAIEEEPLQ